MQMARAVLWLCSGNLVPAGQGQVVSGPTDNEIVLTSPNIHPLKLKDTVTFPKMRPFPLRGGSCGVAFLEVNMANASRMLRPGDAAAGKLWLRTEVHPAAWLRIPKSETAER